MEGVELYLVPSHSFLHLVVLSKDVDQNLAEFVHVLKIRD